MTPVILLHAFPLDSRMWQQQVDVLSGKFTAKEAAVLLVFLSKRTFDHNGEFSVTHSFDTGAAWENFALQATLKNLVVHGMEGFDYERARTVLKVPHDFQVEAMAAVGRPGKKEDLPLGLQEREFPNDRRPLAELVSEGPYIAPGAGAHAAWSQGRKGDSPAKMQ